jgi:hypothetical protein
MFLNETLKILIRQDTHLFLTDLTTLSQLHSFVGVCIVELENICK